MGSAGSRGARAMMAAFFGELAAFHAQTSLPGFTGNPMTGCGCLCAQAIWSIRVPCPGGRAARTGGCDAAARASSLVAVSGVLGWLESGVCTGADAGMLEILLMGKILGCYARL